MNKMVKNCVFCKIVSGEILSEKVFENDNFIVIKDAHPETEGHSLVIPKKHCDSFRELKPELYQDFMKTTKELSDKINGDFNLIINTGKDAGQVVGHFHLHFIPRKKGDNCNVIL